MHYRFFTDYTHEKRCISLNKSDGFMHKNNDFFFLSLIQSELSLFFDHRQISKYSQIKIAPMPTRCNTTCYIKQRGRYANFQKRLV